MDFGENPRFPAGKGVIVGTMKGIIVGENRHVRKGVPYQLLDLLRSHLIVGIREIILPAKSAPSLVQGVWK